ncbi:hypothetical protein [Streptomyces sp. NPDC052015]|uniref:hypothetical protein n=1 Tax=Streptomyces sp. NPDC052015 TaxID=3154755 RepID=UPI00342B09D8
MPVAPLVAAFRRRLANLPGPLRTSGEASNGEPVQVEIWVGGEWVDITEYTLVRDNSGRITLAYGIRGGEGSETQAATADLQLKNPDGRFTPRNPSGTWYGQIGRNTPIRISVPDGNGGKSYRIWGEVSEWAPNWDPTGNDVWTDVSANGILQRLAQGPAPERSILYNAITDPPLTGLVAYWPCEDPEGSVELASALTNGSAMTWTGNPALASYTGFGASDPLPTLTGASLTGGIVRYDTSTVTQYQMRYLLAVPQVGFNDLDVISRIQVDQGAYNLMYLDVHYNDPAGGVGSFGGRGTLTIQLYDGDESPLAVSGTESISLDTRGRLLRVSVEVSNNGTALSATLRVLDVASGVTDSTTVGLVSTQVTRVTHVSMAPATLAGSAGVVEAAVGHVLLQTTITGIEDLGRAIQPTGEAAGRRIQRLCAEAGIPFEWVGDLDDTVAMGPQGKANLLTLVQECAVADGGFLYETGERGLGYRTRASLYNQDPAVVLDYAGYNFAEVPVPTEDDRYIQNRITVTVNGVSQSYEETTGALGTARIGTYGETSGLTLNLATTDAATLRDHAAWRVHLGTVDEARYTKISVNLAHPSITPEMRRAILALRLGDRMQITNMPGAWLPPDTVDQLILGREESITHFEHRLAFTCRPASPYSYIGVLDAAEARVDIDTELYEDVGSGDTQLTVVPSAGELSLWTTDSADWPFDVRLGGEVVRVTAVDSWLEDSFTRSESGGWGTADSGQAWGSVGGTVGTDFSVNGSAGVHTLTSVDVSRRGFIDLTYQDLDYYGSITTSATATGGSIYGGLLGRYVSSDMLYHARVEFTTANAVILDIHRRANGAATTLGSYTSTITHAAGTYVRVRFQIRGTALKAKVWAASATEPAEWHVEVTDSAITSPSFVGVRSISAPTNTNVNPQVRYDDLAVTNPQTLTVTRSINGVTKSHSAGTPVSLAYPTHQAL